MAVTHIILFPLSKFTSPFIGPLVKFFPSDKKTEDDEAELALQRLPAPGLWGTRARAYALLTCLLILHLGLSSGPGD